MYIMCSLGKIQSIPCTIFDDADGLDDCSGNADDVVTSTTCLKVKHTVFTLASQTYFVIKLVVI